MRIIRKVGRLWRRRQPREAVSFLRAHDELRRLTLLFSEASTLTARTRRATQLFAAIWLASTERRFEVRLLRWIRMLEQDAELRRSFAQSWGSMLAELDAVPLFAETGLPGQQALPAEVMRRLVQRVLPAARGDADAGRLLASLFANSRAVERMLSLQGFVRERLVELFRPADGAPAAKRLQEDLRQALCLLAARIAGRGATAAVRQRSGERRVDGSPFYQLIFATEALVRAETDGARFLADRSWQKAAKRCVEELDQIHLHMEDAGVSSALVYDLRSIEAALGRMELLRETLMSAERGDLRWDGPANAPEAKNRFVLRLLDTLLQGRLNDTHLRFLVHENLNLLARKTVERTGHGGEHYIAHTRRDYWLMWRAGIGGGLLTVFTAAIKMRLMESHFPLAVEGFFIGTDYAVSFVLLQILGFALATKQPSMTAAALAGIVRENRGVSRWSRISEFLADICRTQLAAAFSNVIAVCLGAVMFERLWRSMFRTHYLPEASALHVSQTLHPFTSGTAIFAAFTGLLLWLAAVIGGWCENFSVYHRIPEAIAQHPAGAQLGTRTMRRLADWLERSVGSWSTSIVLGYLLGFSPVVARFFGVPLDVRHVTLSTGTLALAAARFGTDSFGHGWLYWAAAGIGITFVLNLGVSFAIASTVALRAYDVPREEQAKILRFLLSEIVASPLSFIFPIKDEMLSVTPNGAIADETAEDAHGKARKERANSRSQLTPGARQG